MMSGLPREARAASVLAGDGDGRRCSTGGFPHLRPRPVAWEHPLSAETCG